VPSALRSGVSATLRAGRADLLLAFRSSIPPSMLAASRLVLAGIALSRLRACGRTCYPSAC
jgi:hypothetical protein